MKISPSIRFLLSFTINPHNSFLPSTEDRTHFIIMEGNELNSHRKAKSRDMKQAEYLFCNKQK